MANEKTNGNNNEEPVVTEVKEEESTLKKIGKAITKPFRWVGGKIRKSPAATAIGAIGGAGLALGGKYLITKVLNRNGEYVDESTIEIEDAGEEYVNDIDEAV